MKHYNVSISEWANRLFNTKAGDTLSADVHEVITPVISLKPVANIVKSATTATTIYTTPTDKDFYLTSLYLSVAKDAAQTGTSASITAIIDGVTVNLLSFISITLTASEVADNIVFNTPIKIDRGTAIATVASNWTSSRSGLTGYTLEVTK